MHVEQVPHRFYFCVRVSHGKQTALFPTLQSVSSTGTGFSVPFFTLQGLNPKFQGDYAA